jgi:hypothetical protein
VVSHSADTQKAHWCSGVFTQVLVGNFYPVRLSFRDVGGNHACQLPGSVVEFRRPCWPLPRGIQAPGAHLAPDLNNCRLARRTMCTGWVLLLSVLIPYEVAEDRAEFVWQAVPQLPCGLALAALAPAAGGLALLIAGVVRRGATTLALAALSVLLALAATTSLVASPTPWDVLPLQESWTRSSCALLLLVCRATAGWESRTAFVTACAGLVVLAAVQ